MSSNRSAPGLLDPATLARELKAATGLSEVTSSDDAAATRIALDAVEKTAALLRAQLDAVDVSGDVDNTLPPPAKRRAVEQEGAVVAAAVPAPGARGRYG